MNKVVLLEYGVESAGVEVISLTSPETLLDADIVMVNPSGVARHFAEARKAKSGMRRLESEQGADDLREAFERRQREIKSLMDHGKVVFVLVTPIAVIEAQVRSSGNSTRMTNYDWCPSMIEILVRIIVEGTGSEIALTAPSHPVAQYFKAFRNELHYKAYLLQDLPGLFTSLMTNKTNNPVSFSLAVGRGQIIFLPWPVASLQQEKLVNVLIQCALPLLRHENRTPVPEWANKQTVPGGERLLISIQECSDRIAEIEEVRLGLETELEALLGCRSLLYEQGAALEDAAIRAFALMGFEADRFKKADIDHDIILKAHEGKAVVEVEGKDDDAIHVDKVDQLSSVFDEYFTEFNEYPEAILLGNPYRLKPLEERGDPFTEKTRKAVERKKFKLLTTPELFRATVRQLEQPENADLKAALRRAVIECKGEQIVFPV